VIVRAPTRHLVLDNEAVRTLLSTRSSDRKRAVVVEAIAAANGRRAVPTAVRGEAGWRRTDPKSANANRLVAVDDELDRVGADRVVQLRSAVPAASVVDASVVLAAERVGAGDDVVEVLTSDAVDLQALAAHARVRVDVVVL
jgi:hypothetical protein